MVRSIESKEELFALSEARPVFQHACKKLESINLWVTDLEPFNNVPHDATATIYLPVGKDWKNQSVGSLQYYGGQNKFESGYCSSIEWRFVYKFLHKAPALAEVISDSSLPFRVKARKQYAAFHLISPNRSAYLRFIDQLTDRIKLAMEKDFGTAYKSLTQMPIRDSVLKLPLVKR